MSVMSSVYVQVIVNDDGAIEWFISDRLVGETWHGAVRSAYPSWEALMSDNDVAKPGDEAAPGVPGTGENLCPDCGGTGKIEGRACPECNGTGKVITGIGGG